ncbi:MAG: hypothetical protein SGJ20_15380 [Planctomycetota bacterium]|nr:hypothetical protein [Planctomycetota bacterium]
MSVPDELPTRTQPISAPVALLLGGILFCVVLFCGCVNQQTEGTATVYTSSKAIVVFIIVMGAFICLLGIRVLRIKEGKRWAWRIVATLFFLIGIGISAFMVPLVLYESVRIDDQEIVIQSQQSSREVTIRYDEIARVQATAMRTEHPRDCSKFWLIVHLKDGRQQELIVNDLLSAALPQLLEKLKQHQIPLIDPENLPRVTER